jgi:hypothetical protein
MKYQIETDLNDGKNNAPPLVVDVNNIGDGDFYEHIIGELCNDYDEPFGVGMTLTITRIS